MLNEAFLCRIATAFRSEFELLIYSDIPDFPDGQCNRASELISKFLIEEFSLSPFLVYGDILESDGSGSHCWLEVTGITIDITADQFESNDSKIIVTGTPDWHNASFTDITREHAHDYALINTSHVRYNCPTVQTNRKIYENMKPQIQAMIGS